MIFVATTISGASQSFVYGRNGNIASLLWSLEVR